MSSVSDSYLTCSKCANKTYVDTARNTCVPGDILDCEVYSNQSNCQVCSNQFFLNVNNTACTKHPDIAGCVTYSQTTGKTCNYCQDLHFAFIYQNYCLQANFIPGCKYFDTASTCLECQEGYFLNQSLTCDVIPNSENCLVKKPQFCKKCVSTHYTDTADNKCHPIKKYQSASCAKEVDLLN